MKGRLGLQMLGYGAGTLVDKTGEVNPELEQIWVNLRDINVIWDRAAVFGAIVRCDIKEFGF